MMSIFSKILLLAACSTTIIAGPVPRNVRRQLFTSYANTTSSASATVTFVQTSSTLTLPSETSSKVVPLPSGVSIINNEPSISTGPQANANTALIIEPIQRTVITRVMPAVTFRNPKGEAIATQEVETVLFTSYFTPSPAPAAPSSAAASSSIVLSSSPTSKSVTPSSTSSKVLSPSIPTPTPSASSVAAVGSGTLKGTDIPVFTYAPEESSSAKPIGSATPIVSSKPATGNSTGLPGFNHPGASQSVKLTSTPVSPPVAGSSISKPAVPLSSSTGAGISSQQAPVASTPNSLQSTAAPVAANSTSTRAIITKTEYTTVLPSATAPVAISSAAPKPSPSLAQGSELGGVSTTVEVLLSSKSSLVALAPTTPLALPPVIIVTQYTTVAPSSTTGPPETPQIPSSAPIQPTPSPPAAPPFSSAPSPRPSSVLPPPASVPSSASLSASALPSSVPTQPTPSPSPAKPSPPIAPSSPAQASTSAPIASAPPAQASPSTTAAAPSPPIPSSAAPSPTSDSPLAIIPIAPSQIFTVTVTATATNKETVTKTETATVSVTVRA